MDPRFLNVAVSLVQGWMAVSSYLALACLGFAPEKKNESKT